MLRHAIKFKYRYMILLLIIIIAYILIFDPFYVLYKPTQHEIPFFIEHTDIHISRTVSNVPLTIYESWHSNTIPEKMKDCIYDLIKMNPEFDYYLYSDEACLNFIKNHFDQDVVDAFNILKPGAYKSDLWRYCILYKKGGVYLDIKYYSLVPLIDIIEENPIIFVRDIPGGCLNHRGIYNAFMVSPPNNPIFKKCIDDVVNSCKNKLYKRNPLDITGPCLLAEIYIKEYSDTINSFKFDLKESPSGHIIRYNNKEILKIYKDYRKDQGYFQKTYHYGTLWLTGNVYN